MGKVKNFLIKFDDEKAVYAPGAILTGAVHLELAKTKKTSGLFIHFHGEARVRFAKGRPKNSDPANVENYFQHKLPLLTKDNRETFMIAPGKHEFKFEIILPDSVPTSFEGQYGHIRYWARAVLHTEGLLSSKPLTAVLPFTLIQPLNINQDMEAKQCYQGEVSRKFGPCCCPIGSLSLLAQLPHIGYVPGHDIPIGVEVRNKTSRKVLWLKFVLKQINEYNLCNTQYERHEQLRSETIVLAEARCKGVKANRTEVIHRGVTIPPVPPSHLTGSRLISVHYKLETVAKLAGGCFSAPDFLELPSTPIVIGTIPMQSGTASAPTTEPSAPPIESVSAPPAAHLPSEPPPSYMESVLGAHQISLQMYDDSEPNSSHSFNGTTTTAPATTASSRPMVPPAYLSVATTSGAAAPNPAPSAPVEDNDSDNEEAGPSNPNNNPEQTFSHPNSKVMFAPKYSFYRRPGAINKEALVAAGALTL